MKIKIVIGLGNSGEEYQKTYHNAGRLFVDYLNEAGFSIAAIKTDGFMNQSGEAVRKILKMKNLELEDAIIAHDDSDIYLGEYKLSRDRGSAGQKGVENIMEVFGTKDFMRLRIGIRPRSRVKSPTTILPLEYKREEGGGSRQKAGEFVLKNITAANMKILKEVFERAASVILNEMKDPK